MNEADPMKLSFYELDGKNYFICDGEVYTNDEDGNRVKVDMLPSSIQMYGNCLDRPLFELLVTDIKQLEGNKALVLVEDGAGLEFALVEEDYSKNHDKYVIGKKGIYQIVAALESVEVPENCEDGVVLTGKNARKFFDWIEDEVEDNSEAVVSFDDVGVFEPCEDFARTGRYNFYGIASDTGYYSVSEEIDEPDFEKIYSFKIPMMNQFDKENPRFIEAVFDNGECYHGRFEKGWALKAVLRLLGIHGVVNNVYEYGENRTVTPEDKGMASYDDEDYTEDEDGNRWIEDE